MRPWLPVALAVVAVAGAALPPAAAAGGEGARSAVESTAAATPTWPPADVGAPVSNDSGRHCPAAARAGDPPPADPARARIVELYPDPTTRGNAGEYAAVAFPGETDLSGWSITDGHVSAALPNGTVSGTVALSETPAETQRLTDLPVVELEGAFRPAADGDELALYDGDRRVDAVAYGDAPTGDVWYRTRRDVDGESAAADGPAAGQWWPRGATCLPVAEVAAEDATAFVLPDAPAVALETIRRADDRIALAGYTFTSGRVAAELREAAARGVAVEVVVESGPVGGLPAATAAALEGLSDAENATVRVLGGEDARYAYHHAKYAVVDDRVLVTTENWKPSGVGGAGNRGWGVVVDAPAVAADLAAVFAADVSGPDTTTWSAYRENASFVDEGQAAGEFPERTAPETVGVDSVELLLAPDNAEGRLRELLAEAEESILVEQVRIGDRENPLLVEALSAARRGVEVRILLDSTWYVEDENRRLADRLERTADEEDLPLEVALVDPRGRFEKIHAKGVVIDRETAVVGSANWNNNSLRDNREVLLALHGEEAGAYYADAFEEDWDGGSWPLPAGLVGAVAVALSLAGLVGRRFVTFDGAPASVVRPSDPGDP